MQIAIAGVPGAGKSTVAKIVAEKLGYKFYSIGKLRRELAEQRGLTIDQFNSLPENTDEMVDEYQKKLGKEGDNFVNEGRLSFYFLPKAVKFYFDCEPLTAAERIRKENRNSEKKQEDGYNAKKTIQNRMESDRERYNKHYHIDCYDKKKILYDVNSRVHCIDTSILTIDEAVQKVIEIIEKEKERA